MSVYYQDEHTTIWHGESADVLPLLNTADLVLTDPPYGIGEAAGKNKSRGLMAASKDFGVDTWDDQPIDPELLALVRASGRTQIIFGGNYYDLPPTSCWLLWDKENGATDFADAEMAWTNMKKATRLFRWRWQGMLQGDMGNKEFRYHPTQKPVSVMRWCIERAGDGIETIVDPFMGSGTTLRAAKDMGKHAIGIEREEKYCEIAAKRMSQLAMELN
jgi:DNA modification methylase